MFKQVDIRFLILAIEEMQKFFNSLDLVLFCIALFQIKNC